MVPSFEKPLVLLADARVKFILVGGLAVALEGYVRGSGLLDETKSGRILAMVHGGGGWDVIFPQ